MDRTVKLWDLRQGVPLATSRSHLGLVRCVAADEHLLVSGSSDTNLRAWRAQPALPHVFDIAGSGEVLLRGHAGPVTSLSLDRDCVYSGRCAGPRAAAKPAPPRRPAPLRFLRLLPARALAAASAHPTGQTRHPLPARSSAARLAQPPACPHNTPRPRTTHQTTTTHHPQLGLHGAHLGPRRRAGLPQRAQV
jgi:hypothetical protein